MSLRPEPDTNTYDSRTTYHGGYNINTENIDTPVDGTLFDPADGFGFGESNIIVARNILIANNTCV